MDTYTGHGATISTEDVNGCESEAGRSNISSLEGVSSSGDVIRGVENVGKVLTRLELDLARASEKLVNLNVLIMHVAMIESDFEAFALEKEETIDDVAEKALVYDLLSGILDSEVSELNSFMSALQTDVVNARETTSSCQHLGEVFGIMEEKLLDSEESLKQSLDQISEIKEQSDKFQRTVWSFGGQENGKVNSDVEPLKNDEFPSLNAKIKMQTAEQQRHILRMLEKSLARELDLEMKFAESRQIEEHLKLRLHSSDQEVFCLEEEAAVVWERVLESENAAEILLGTSKEILGGFQIVQFNLNSSIQREEELRSNLNDCIEKLKAKDNALQKLESSCVESNNTYLSETNTLKTSLKEVEDKLILANSETSALREKVSSLEKQLKESEYAKALADKTEDFISEIHELRNVIEDLKEKVSKAENRADSAEANCKLLTETNMELTEELTKSSGSTAEKIDALERQLKECNIQLQHAMASAEASEEKQNMLNSTIGDMENLIEDLKSKVLKAENRAENVEDRCIILSESNSDLNEELSFLRGKLECLEASLQQAEEFKKATAKDINIRTKVITDLVMQLALERERLHKKISSLAKQNKILVNFQRNMDYDVKGCEKEFALSKRDYADAPLANENKGEVTEFSSTIFESDKEQKVASVAETEVRPADSASKLESVRNIDARQLNRSYVSMAVLAVLVSALAAFLSHHYNGQY